jgi:hypothetical protein
MVVVRCHVRIHTIPMELSIGTSVLRAIMVLWNTMEYHGTYVVPWYHGINTIWYQQMCVYHGTRVRTRVPIMVPGTIPLVWYFLR